MLEHTDLQHLERAVELARQALEAGHAPFGSLLVAPDGEVLFEDYNRIGDGDATRHPEFAIARWAGENLTPAERARATVYTSGEHCPMCAAAHAWVGLGRIVYASSTTQLGAWLAEWGITPGPVQTLPIERVIVDSHVDGPAPELTDAIRELQRRYHEAARPCA